MIRDRLLQIRELLAPDGSVWLHLDDAEVHRARVVLDEVFGSTNFVATVIWEKTTTPRNDAKHLSVDHDYILVYARNAEQFRPNGMPRSAESDAAYKNPDNDPRGPWREDNYKSNKSADERPNLYYPVVHPRTGEEIWPPRDAVWRFSRDRHEQHLRDGLVWWGKTGNYRLPKLKRFRTSVSDTAVPRTLWFAADVDQSRRAKQQIKALFPDIDPFATPKPERLLQRILHIASQPGDVVLDCFLGSGTTAAVAAKMRRRWVGIESSPDTLVTYAEPRLGMVVGGSDQGGISTEVGWNGGGGFRIFDVSPSMFEAVDGIVYLADQLTNGALAEATAAQLGFEYEPDPPFAGRKGRSRLAVIDGVVNEGVVRLVANALPESERVVVCGTGIDPDARETLRALRPGSTMRKIPSALLETYREPTRLQQLSMEPNATESKESTEAEPIGKESADV